MPQPQTQEVYRQGLGGMDAVSGNLIRTNAEYGACWIPSISAILILTPLLLTLFVTFGFASFLMFC